MDQFFTDGTMFHEDRDHQVDVHFFLCETTREVRPPGEKDRRVIDLPRFSIALLLSTDKVKYVSVSV